jgi:hypothetical protein
VAIAANTPSSSGGAVAAYSISPALPAGLAFSPSTGVITGTPTTLAAAANYTVTPTNAGGSTTAALTIAVNDVAPSALSYSANPVLYTSGLAIADNTPHSSGGPVVSYSVSPALPAGLNLNTSTGVITGTPTTATAAVTYTVTASNSGGFTSAALTITVLSPLQAWRQQFFGTTNNNGSAADTADPYHTGIPNLLAFAFFGPSQDPSLLTQNQLPHVQISGGNLVYSFTQPVGVTGLTYGAVWADAPDSGNWTPISDTGSGNLHVFIAPVGGNSKMFIRLTVSSP